jgi:DNA-binding XRE family transcriptional regulator
MELSHHISVYVGMNIPSEVVSIKLEHDIPWAAAYRIYRGLSRSDLANSLGLDVDVYSEIESASSLADYQLGELAKALGVSYKTLYKLYHLTS